MKLKYELLTNSEVGKNHLGEDEKKSHVPNGDVDGTKELKAEKTVEELKKDVKKEEKSDEKHRRSPSRSPSKDRKKSRR